ncbi:uncharacterized protein LOC142235176 [Haematobia irritans]|uniref:uncharacterized protein LOC142235176 n=1 Tax=Haematobia irritans TaxID=7368 RepID=UPI003F4FFC05
MATAVPTSILNVQETTTNLPIDEDTTTLLPYEEPDLCGVADSNNIFMCISDTKYVLLIDLKLVHECQEDYVCNIENKSGFCSERTLTKPSCTADDYNDIDYEVNETTTVESPTIADIPEEETTTDATVTETPTEPTVTPTTTTTDAAITEIPTKPTITTTTSSPTTIDTSTTDATMSSSTVMSTVTSTTSTSQRPSTEQTSPATTTTLHYSRVPVAPQRFVKNSAQLDFSKQIMMIPAPNLYFVTILMMS